MLGLTEILVTHSDDNSKTSGLPFAMGFMSAQRELTHNAQSESTFDHPDQRLKHVANNHKTMGIVILSRYIRMAHAHTHDMFACPLRATA